VCSMVLVYNNSLVNCTKFSEEFFTTIPIRAAPKSSRKIRILSDLPTGGPSDGLGQCRSDGGEFMA
jgi:hypothetical protein